MLRTRVIPCLLLQDRRLVKTVNFKNPAYIGDPINAIKIYNDKEVDEIIVLDITASRENKKPPFNFIKELANECFMPMAYGGGIKSIEDIRTILSLGIEKIVINSFAVENPQFLRAAAAEFGSQSIVVCIDVKRSILGNYLIQTHGGSRATKLNPFDFAQKAEQYGAGEIIINSIDRDGTWSGYDLKLINGISKAVTVPVIALGGAGKIEDFGSVIKETHASGVSAGSMFVFQNKGLGVLINFPKKEDLNRVLVEQQHPKNS